MSPNCAKVGSSRVLLVDLVQALAGVAVGETLGNVIKDHLRIQDIVVTATKTHNFNFI